MTNFLISAAGVASGYITTSAVCSWLVHNNAITDQAIAVAMLMK